MTYISVASVPARRAVVLPAWMWGAEMGTNDAGVVIGNEAVFTKSKGKKVERLTGMDLLRLARARRFGARSRRRHHRIAPRLRPGRQLRFRQALLLEATPFLIAGSDSAFILETSGSDWILQDVRREGISNVLSQDGPYLATSKPGSIVRMPTPANPSTPSSPKRKDVPAKPPTASPTPISPPPT
ncbi:MAG: hypothetical protein MZW92_12315 [Comamonadaceae bacterium]|nr:hypothetical protein [Comamonadaceae bacterium]